MAFYSRWQTKPPAGTRIDWTNPLTSGLQCAFAFNEGSGFPADLVVGKSTTATGGVGTWGGSQFGNVLTIPSSVYYAAAGKPTTYSNVTMIYVGKTTKDASSGGRLVCTSTSSINGLALANNSQGTSPFCLLLGGVAWVMPTTAITPPSTTPVFLGISTTSPISAATLFYMQRYDTGAVVTSGCSGSSTATTGNGSIALAGQSGALPTISNDFDLALVYNRSLSLQEFRLLAANPWQIFAPLAPYWSNASTSAGPPQLTNLVAWFKADKGVFQGAGGSDTGATNPATTTAQPIALWQDQSGIGNHVLQATSAKRPTYATGVLNGLPSLKFVRASSQYLASSGTATLGISTTNWWVAVVYVTGSAMTNSGTLLSVGAYAPAFYMPASNTHTRQLNYYQGADHIFANNVALSTAYLSEITCTSGTIKAYQAAVGTAPGVDANTFTGGASIADGALGVGNDTAGDYLNGQICEILVYKTALNSTDQAALESYLATRYQAVVTFAPWIFSSEDC